MYHVLVDDNEAIVHFSRSCDVLRDSGRASQLCLVASFETEEAAEQVAVIWNRAYSIGYQHAMLLCYLSNKK